MHYSVPVIVIGVIIVIAALGIDTRRVRLPIKPAAAGSAADDVDVDSVTSPSLIDGVEAVAIGGALEKPNA